MHACVYGFVHVHLGAEHVREVHIGAFVDEDVPFFAFLTAYMHTAALVRSEPSEWEKSVMP